VSSNRVSAILVEVVTSDERLRGEGPVVVWLIGVVMCLLAATADPMSVSAGNGWPHLRCSTTGSCQSTATSHCRGIRGSSPSHPLPSMQPLSEWLFFMCMSSAPFDRVLCHGWLITISRRCCTVFLKCIYSVYVNNLPEPISKAFFLQPFRNKTVGKPGDSGLPGKRTLKWRERRNFVCTF